jgi:hypothetical protein
MKQFLSSTWKNTFIITWEIEPELLMEHLPHKIGLYTYEGKALISLVVHNFENTKVKGIKMPFHVSFPEMDLRYYVKFNNQIGVGFIQHIVTRYCISLWAKRIFNENYITLPMDYSFQETETSRVLHYKVWRDKNMFSLDFLSNKEFTSPSFSLYNQVEYGIGVDKYGNSIKFKFEKIEDYQSSTALDYALKIDFSVLFGKKWFFLNELEPVDVVFLSDNKVRIFQPSFVFETSASNIENYLQNHWQEEQLERKNKDSLD